jgi:hypothetical protein
MVSLLLFCFPSTSKFVRTLKLKQQYSDLLTSDLSHLWTKSYLCFNIEIWLQLGSQMSLNLSNMVMVRKHAMYCATKWDDLLPDQLLWSRSGRWSTLMALEVCVYGCPFTWQFPVKKRYFQWRKVCVTFCPEFELYGIVFVVNTESIMWPFCETD